MYRDLESQLVVLTQNKLVQELFRKVRAIIVLIVNLPTFQERDNIFGHAKPVTADTFDSEDRKLPWHVQPFTFLAKQYM